MKRLISSLLALALLAFFGVVPARAADPGAPAKKIRVLLTYGGHGFEEKPFFAMFDSIPDIQVTRVELPKGLDLLKPGLEKDYDVIVRYDMCSGISPEQQKAFVELLNRGIGLVALHHNLGAHSKWDEYRKIIGGKFCLTDCEIDGQKFKTTPWRHDEDLKISVADKDHPITKDVADFEIHDETYGKYYTAPGIHVLLKTDHPRNNPLLGWTTKYGKSPVFFLMLGHDGRAYANPSFQKLVAQGIRWAAAK
jgi:type 1 glutamine amidotransferase